MTDQMQLHCLSMLAGLPSSAPWSEATAVTYAIAMEGWTDEVAEGTLRRVVQTEEWRPAPARLIAIAVDLFAPMPPAYQVRQQIRQMLLWHGGRAAAQLAAKEFPLLHQVADLLGGWANLVHMGSEEIDERFPLAYQGVAREWAAGQGRELLQVEGKERLALLGASRGPGSVRTRSLRLDAPERSPVGGYAIAAAWAEGEEGEEE